MQVCRRSDSSAYTVRNAQPCDNAVQHTRLLLLLLLPAVRLVAAQLGWQVVPPGSADCQWDLFWTDTSISQERLLRLAPTQVRMQQQQLKHC